MNGDTAPVCPTCGTPLGDRTTQLLATVAASESRFRAAFADAGVGMALIGDDDRIIEANPAFAALLGRDAADLVRMRIHDLIDPEETPRALFQELAHGKHERLRLERRLRHRTGRSVWSKVTVSLIRDGDGNPLSTLAVVEDVTEQRMLGDRLAFQTLHDPLTRLPNRTLFFERLDAAFRTAGGPLNGDAGHHPGPSDPALPPADTSTAAVAAQAAAGGGARRGGPEVPPHRVAARGWHGGAGRRRGPA
ncbi:PAS domain S-box protein, partial [Kitasatospora sp. NPDC059571]|uniref:PAS domain S-box protein n=1 Tax=Kitasatospora sp. NPDC059571 TaxID=3346871 RepID=UPI0036D0614B